MDGRARSRSWRRWALTAVFLAALIGCASTAAPQDAPSSAPDDTVVPPSSILPSAPTPAPNLTPGPSNETDQATNAPTAAPEATSESKADSIPDNPQALVTAFLELVIGGDSASVQAMRDSGDPSYIPVLVDYLRFTPPSDAHSRDVIIRALEDLSGAAPDEAEGSDRFWSWWVRWLGRHSEVRGIEGYDAFKGLILERLVDPAMGVFFSRGVDSRIRLEEIVWGGVAKDGIPDLTNPRVMTPEEAVYLFDDDRVFGVSFNGEHRAYPLCILNAHEMTNDVVGGVPFALAY